MKKLIILCTVVSFNLMFFTGCGTTHKDSLSIIIDANELSGHVHFLADPSLKGRKPLSLGSSAARKYISRQFKAYGLVPWGDTKSYTQSLVVGTNVIGVLPGSDPNLRKEFIIVCAHYDHVGKTKEGICLGACDNASGVAALLEIAEKLSLSEVKTKRSICFAAFDCEEIGLLGAFAFSSRPDFDESKIAGVVNIDLLGRYGYEVLEEHLFVSGIDECASLLKELKQADSDIQLLSVGKDLVGLRGDHFPFELLECPVLFFSCGLFKDYHKITDTADKLDYPKMLKSTNIILHTINVMANQPRRFVKEISPEGQREILMSMETLLNHIIAGYEKLGWTQKQVDSMEILLKKLKESLKENQIDSQSRRIFSLSQYEHLQPIILWPEDSNNTNSSKDMLFSQSKASCGLNMIASDIKLEIIQTARAFVKHLSMHRSRVLLGIPDFKHFEEVLLDDYITVTKVDKDTYCLVYIPISLTVNIKPHGLLKLFHWNDPVFSPRLALVLNVIRGSQDDIIDICLLRWINSELNYQNKSSKYNLSEEGNDDDRWQRIISKVTEMNEPETYQQCLKNRLTQGKWTSEESWLLAKTQSTNPDVAIEAIHLSTKILQNEKAEETLCNIVNDRVLNPRIRAVAINTLKAARKSTLLVLVENLDDKTKIPVVKPQICTDSYSIQLFEFLESELKNYPNKSDVIKNNDNSTSQTESKVPRVFNVTKGSVLPPDFINALMESRTIGSDALSKLMLLTNQDFRMDKQKWIAWINTHEN